MNRIAFLVTLGVCSCLGSAASVDPNGAEFFTQKVLPILQNRCLECHSHDAGKIKAGLAMDSKEGLLQGGETGPAVVPGDLKKSLMIVSVHYADEDLQMPPKQKLPAGEIAVLEQWIKMGAPDPRVSAPGVGKTDEIWERSREHWAFQPLRMPAVPAVKDGGWGRNEIDAFVFQKLADKGLAPSKTADKFTLIRRATYDLTGLPPTYEEVQAFLSDNSTDAYEKLVDRLLASPHYGERWGRYWLDVARYADTSGEAIARGRERRYIYAYTYRDWVIQALNGDMPYNQFVMKQIAADLLPDRGPNDRDLAALGFITVGKRFGNNADELIDDRIDVVTRGFMGLTVNCARCHDHKFDPVPTEDYYSLHGIFNSTTDPVEGPVIERADSSPEYADYLKQIEQAENVVAQYEDEEWHRVLGEAWGKFDQYLLAIHDYRRNPGGLNFTTFYRTRGLSPGICNLLDRSYFRTLASRKSLDPIFGPWLAFSALSDKDFAAKASQMAAQFAADPSLHPLVAGLFKPGAPKSIKDLAARYGTLLAEADKRHQEARRAMIQSLGHWEAVQVKLDDPAWESLRKFLWTREGPIGPHSLNFQAEAGLRSEGRRYQLIGKVNDIKMTHPASPDRAMVLQDLPQPRNSKVYVRGDRGKQGKEAPRQFLQIISGDQRKPYSQGSGRLELARDIADPENPLTPRVIVNRVWMNHFGAGLVATPSDFGLRGETPTHPQLLEWLAVRLIEQGWSLKKLHRSIMTSATYMQRSDNRPECMTADPTNALLWKMNRRRLDFEASRDTLLMAGGTLDLRVGGRSIDVLENTSRRTIYGLIDRYNLPGVFTTFDFALPDMTSPQRIETTVPTQALFWMNSPFVIEQARKLAARPDIAKAPSDEQRLRTLYRLLFQRDPGKQDLADGLAFLAKAAAPGSVEDDAPDWRYGMGVYQFTSKRMVFTESKRFVNDEWSVIQRGDKGVFTRVTLDAVGGQTGTKTSESAVRRWIAPIDGPVGIKGNLTHVAAKGSVAVLGRIVHTRPGQEPTILGEWTARQGKVATTVDRVQVRKGDTIDFIASPRGEFAETFRWAPTIDLQDLEAASGRIERHRWSAQADFQGPQPPAPKGLTPLEKYAQALLLTNELVYVN
jgi:hypothetical protein